MMLLAWLIAAAHACDLGASIAALKDTGGKEDYLCAAADPGGATALVTALDGLQGTVEELDGPRGRYTRAITLWLLQQDVGWDAVLVRRLSADDRRLLSDGVRARRGRPSPSPAHDAIFKNLPWYKPDAGYTDGRLSPDDRAKIALADNPPPVPAPVAKVNEVEEARREAAAAQAARDAQPMSLCGCATSGQGSALGALGAGLLLVRRRRAGGTSWARTPAAGARSLRP